MKYEFNVTIPGNVKKENREEHMVLNQFTTGDYKTVYFVCDDKTDVKKKLSYIRNTIKREKLGIKVYNRGLEIWMEKI